MQKNSRGCTRYKGEERYINQGDNSWANYSDIPIYLTGKSDLDEIQSYFFSK